MTGEMMNPRLLVEKSAGCDLLRELIGFTAQRLTELEVGQAMAAAHGEKKLAQACPTQWLLRAGLGDMGRDGGAAHSPLEDRQLFLELLEPRRMAEMALTAAIQEAYIQGISTRRVDGLVKAMGRTSPLRSP